MKKLLVVLMLVLMTGSAHAVYLRYCSNIGTTYSFSFGSCVNDNFRTAEREIPENLFVRYCSNGMSEGISFGFQACVNDNFRSIERELDADVFLRYCSNFPNDQVGFGFVSCVNSNFSAIRRALQ